VSRYRIPDPKCRHRHHAVRVTAGDPYEGAYATRWVCDRPECIEDAKQWAGTYTRQPVEVVRVNEWSTAEAAARDRRAATGKED
jgi:hypothetical protein